MSILSEFSDAIDTLSTLFHLNFSFGCANHDKKKTLSTNHQKSNAIPMAIYTQLHNVQIEMRNKKLGTRKNNDLFAKLQYIDQDWL